MYRGRRGDGLFEAKHDGIKCMSGMCWIGEAGQEIHWRRLGLVD
jgi:hypothetical protein